MIECNASNARDVAAVDGNLFHMTSITSHMLSRTKVGNGSCHSMNGKVWKYLHTGQLVRSSPVY